MKNFDLIMIATHQDNLNIHRLIDSIIENNTNIELMLLVISQDCTINQIVNQPFFTINFIKQDKIGLSKARNIGLKFLEDHGISAEYIMFPDDDTSFNNDFFENFHSIIGSNKSYITPIYKAGTKELYFGKKTKDNKLVTIKDHQLIGSPNQIILYNEQKNQIMFDEKLGVGAKYGSSEDLDLFYKLLKIGNQYIFINNLYNFHPAKTNAYKNVKLASINNRFKNYSSGFAYFVFKYKLFRLIPEYLFRTVAASFIFALKLDFKLAMSYFIQFFVRVKLLYYFASNKVSFK